MKMPCLWENIIGIFIVFEEEIVVNSRCSPTLVIQSDSRSAGAVKHQMYQSYSSCYETNIKNISHQINPTHTLSAHMQ